MIYNLLYLIITLTSSCFFTILKMQLITYVSQHSQIDFDTKKMEELRHKSFNLKEACADFVSQGWKFIHPESLEVVNDYKLATFKRISNIESTDILLKIFDDQILELLIVNNFFLLNLIKLDNKQKKNNFKNSETIYCF